MKRCPGTLQINSYENYEQGRKLLGLQSRRNAKIRRMLYSSFESLRMTAPIIINYPSGPLPVGVAPRGFNRAQAAAYIGVSENTFDTLVEQGLMPQPRKVLGRVIWDLLELDDAFSRLPYRDGGNKPGDAPWGNT
jgi:predicted DNA-binding transcriptional regulator AlpA